MNAKPFELCTLCAGSLEIQLLVPSFCFFLCVWSVLLEWREDRLSGPLYTDYRPIAHLRHGHVLLKWCVTALIPFLALRVCVVFRFLTAKLRTWHLFLRVSTKPSHFTLAVESSWAKMAHTFAALLGASKEN